MAGKTQGSRVNHLQAGQVETGAGEEPAWKGQGRVTAGLGWASVGDSRVWAPRMVPGGLVPGDGYQTITWDTPSCEFIERGGWVGSSHMKVRSCR